MSLRQPVRRARPTAAPRPAGRGATKIVPEELVPVTPLGRLVLNRNPDNFFAETEQVAFCAAHVIPGVDFTNDPLLAGRIHSYQDTQLSRLGGPNFHEIPINASVVPVNNNQRDGLHRQTIHRGRMAYEPNSLAGGCPFQAGNAGFVAFPEPVSGVELTGKPEKFAEHYNQARLFFNSQTPAEQKHIIDGFAFELSKVTVPAGGKAAAEAMMKNGEALGFVRTLVRHCKPMLVLGEGAQVLNKAGIDSKASFPGVHVAAKGGDATGDFISAMIRHRHFERETDP